MDAPSVVDFAASAALVGADACVIFCKLGAEVLAGPLGLKNEPVAGDEAAPDGATVDAAAADGAGAVVAAPLFKVKGLGAGAVVLGAAADVNWPEAGAAEKSEL